MLIIKEAPILQELFCSNIDKTIDLKTFVLKKMYHFYTYTYASTAVDEFNSQIAHFYKLEFIEFKKTFEKKRKPSLVQKYISSQLHKNIKDSIGKFSAKFKSVDKPGLHTFAPISHETAGRAKIQRLTRRFENSTIINTYMRHRIGDDNNNTFIDKSLVSFADVLQVKKIERTMRDVIDRESITVNDNFELRLTKLPLLKVRKNDRVRLDLSMHSKTRDQNSMTKIMDLKMSQLKDEVNYKKDAHQNFITHIFNTNKNYSFKTNLLVKELIKYHIFFRKFSKKHNSIRETDFTREYKEYGIDFTHASEMFKLMAKLQKKIDFKLFVKYFKPGLDDQELDKALVLMKKILMMDNKLIDYKELNILNL